MTSRIQSYYSSRVQGLVHIEYDRTLAHTLCGSVPQVRRRITSSERITYDATMSCSCCYVALAPPRYPLEDGYYEGVSTTP